MRIAIVTISTPGYAAGDLCLQRLRPYCARHGYDLHLHKGPHPRAEAEGLDLVWSKLPYIEDLLSFSPGAYDWVMWLDADTLIMKEECALEVALPELLDHGGAYLGAAADHFGLNAGVLFVRPCTEAKAFMAHWWETRHAFKGRLFQEQTSMAYILMSKEGAKVDPAKALLRMNPTVINACIHYNGAMASWRDTLVLHFAGLPHPDLFMDAVATLGVKGTRVLLLCAALVFVVGAFYTVSLLLPFKPLERVGRWAMWILSLSAIVVVYPTLRGLGKVETERTHQEAPKLKKEVQDVETMAVWPYVLPQAVAVAAGVSLLVKDLRVFVVVLLSSLFALDKGVCFTTHHPLLADLRD